MDNKDTELYNDIYNEISSEFGKETAIRIFKMYKGQQITFPMHLYNVKKIRDTIAIEFNGSNLKELSAKYDYSEKTLRRLIKSYVEDLADQE